MAKPRVGLILSGCGVQDGSEIQEATITLLELARAGAEAVCMAPDAPQVRVVDHLHGKEAAESRNMLRESARIARGSIRDIREVRAADLEALILPGGYGAATNLSDFASAGEACALQPDVERLLVEMHAAGKPIGAMCIAPPLVARALAKKGIRTRVTIGTDRGTAERVEKMGAEHVDCPAGEIVIDEANRIVSTPAYMLAQGIAEAAEGITKLVREVIRFAR
jgi:enhancing lycopene biosynthesis protein 2